MISISFEDDDLRVLLRVVIAGKFFGSLRDREIPASPGVASIATRIADAVDTLDSQVLDKETLALVRQWRQIDPRRDEWRIALEFAGSSFAARWNAWDKEQRHAIIRNLLAPFTVDSDELELFDREVANSSRSSSDDVG
jgi:hypothetical protein